uniref:ABC transporter ATP-binding protein n=1 Tax=Candidatus Onthocola sp. TaxID=3085646 RepID=UPI003FEE82D5
MPRPNKDITKAKDFKGAIKRLLKELSGFKKLVIISLVLAALGAILTIVTPNILSDLTDEISKGLVLNKDNFLKLTKEVTSSLNEESISKVIDFSEKNIGKVMMSSNIPKDDLMKFQEIMAKLNDETNNKSFKAISEMPDSILDILVNNDEDAKIFIKSLNSNLVIPEGVASKIFSDIEIDGHVIDAASQGKFLEIVSNIGEDVSATEIYSLVDNMPSSVKVVVEPYMNIDKIKNIAILLICIYLISAIFEYFEAILMTDVSNNFARKLRGNISSKINKLPLKYFDKHAIGDILSRVTNDVDTIAQSMNQSLSTLVSAIALFMGTTIMMFVTNSVMAITAILASLFGFVFMALVLAKSQKYFVAKQNELGALNGHIEEVYSGLNVVKTYNGEKISNEKFDELNDKLYKANWKSGFLSGLMMPMMSFIGNFGYVAVCVVGALLALNGHISFGVIVAFIVYVRLFVSPLSQIAQAMTSLQSTAAASERVFEFLDEKEMADESNIKTTLDKEKVKGNIEFKNVEFKYDGNDKPTIKNFSAKAKAGEKVAIVGPTGAGKTTMVNLLMKFYDINNGEILIDGVSTKDLTRSNIHDLFTMVLQDTWVFNGSIKDNIIYNTSDVSMEMVESVCKTVGLDHFIKTLPNGYDTILSDNDSVSAGQRQLLTIARGMIQNAPFLILDEATSNVDTRTEELVQKAMDKLTEGKTSFIIAHRLSTIKNADLILVMNEGNIIEQGTHDELMKQNGFYAELYNSQFRL